MIPLINEEFTSIEWNKLWHFQRKLEHKYISDKTYRKVLDHCYYAGKYRGAADSMCILEYSIPK